MGTLTVRENFMFSANLRLSKKVKSKEKEKRVEDTIIELGLVNCADSKVCLYQFNAMSVGRCHAEYITL
jgi:ATP-binding cassette subfamily G (WHITE) protein 2